MKVASFDKVEWIDPWIDRYPMTDDTVLVTYFYDGKLRVDTARYRKGIDLYGIISFSGIATEGWCCPGTVLAWQPLPEAYDPVAEAE